MRPRRIPGLPKLGCISIHAPQWGATVHDAAAESFQSISIHAPQWGATHGRQYISQSRTHFNPRTPVGCDVYDYSNAETAELFQSTHPSGVRPAPRTMQSRPTRYFNPRTPVGCDRCRRYGSPAPSNFNPRTPVGCDLHIKCRLDLRRAISIHAPQWGATWMAGVHDQPCGFQSTHPSGVRQGTLHVVERWVRISIHAPQWGATLPKSLAVNGTLFQSTHPSGVRRATSLNVFRQVGVSCLVMYFFRVRGGDVFLDSLTGRRTPSWRSTAGSSATGPWTCTSNTNAAPPT